MLLKVFSSPPSPPRGMPETSQNIPRGLSIHIFKVILQNFCRHIFSRNQSFRPFSSIFHFVDFGNVARVSPSLLNFCNGTGEGWRTPFNINFCMHFHSLQPAYQLLHFCHIRLLLWVHFNLDLQFFRPTCLPCLVHFQDPVSDRPDSSFFCLLLDFDHYLQVKYSFAKLL